MVVVMSFGSSEDPMGAGSTYFSVVKSVEISQGCPQILALHVDFVPFLELIFICM